jgi:hypothetical protein
MTRPICDPPLQPDGGRCLGWLAADVQEPGVEVDVLASQSAVWIDPRCRFGDRRVCLMGAAIYEARTTSMIDEACNRSRARL